MSGRADAEILPIPFYEDPWPRAKKPYAAALWDFHRQLVDAEAPALDGTDLTAYFDSERARVMSGEPLRSLPEETTREVYAAVREFRLPGDLLGSQITAARTFKDPIRFADSRDVGAFIQDWAHAHGRILAYLAGVTGSWQLRYVDELATAFFWVGRLATLKEDLARDWLFIPHSDLELAGVTIDDLRRGAVTEEIRRLLWKQTIRAKDAFAQSEPLVLDLPRRYARAVKRWWIGGLEVINEIVRRDYDVWTEPISLSRFYRAQVWMQANFGRTTFRSR